MPRTRRKPPPPRPAPHREQDPPTEPIPVQAVDIELHLYQHQALVEAIAILQVLPETDDRIRTILNLLDMAEIDARETLRTNGFSPGPRLGPTGRHYLPD